MKKSLLAVAAIAVLASCASHQGMPAPQMTFSNYQTVMLNVQSAAVDEQYLQPNDPQDVSGQFVIAPSEAVKRYAAKRYQAAGSGTGLFTLVIEDARVHMRQLNQDNKVLSWSGVGKEDEYHLYLQLKVVTTPDGMQGRSTTTIKMDRTLVMPSSVTLADREMRQVQFLEKLMADVDVKIADALDATPNIRK